MTKIEKLRNEYKSWGRWYYHMTLDSLGKRNLFNDRDEYVNGMNVVALSQFLSKVGIIQFDIMRNHAHFTLLATGLQCCRYFDFLRFRFNDRLIADGYPPLPDDWFFLLNRLETLNELTNAVSYSARNSYDAKGNLLPGGYLWSSNYLMFSEINDLLDYRTVEDVGVRGMQRLLGSKVKLPSDYKVSKLGFILPESYLLKTDDGSMTKARSLYKDSKDYAYRLFRDYDTYRKIAPDLGEVWTPSGADVDAMVSNMLNMKMEVADIAVGLGVRYGLRPEEIATKLNISTSMVSKLLYSYSKKNKVTYDGWSNGDEKK